MATRGLSGAAFYRKEDNGKVNFKKKQRKKFKLEIRIRRPRSISPDVQEDRVALKEFARTKIMKLLEVPGYIGDERNQRAGVLDK